MIEPAAVALHAVRRAEFTRGSSAIIIGAGTIGLLVGLWLKQRFGARRVLVADVNDRQLLLANKLGLETRQSIQLSPLADNAFEFAFETAGAAEALAAAIRSATDFGVVVVVGRDKDDTRIPLSEFERFMRKEMKLVGSWGYDVDRDEHLIRDVIQRRDFEFSSVISHDIALHDAPHIIRKLINQRNSSGKLMINIGATHPQN